MTDLTDLHIHIESPAMERKLDLIIVALGKLKTTVEQGMATLEERLAAVEATLTKASAELTAEIQTLTDALAAAGTLSAEADASLTRIQGIADALDAMNPDAPATP